MRGYVEIPNRRAKVLGKIIVSFDDHSVTPFSFNATEYSVNCFGYICTLLIYDKQGCYYRDGKEGE